MKKLLSLLMGLCLLLALVPTASASEDVALFSFTGTAGIHDWEGPENLCDGVAGGKWCVRMSSRPYAAFLAGYPASITGYTLTTGDDNDRYTGRNPASWSLFGATDGDGQNYNWQLIDSRKNDRTMKDIPYTPYTFKLDRATPAYSYFMLVVDATQGADVLQLSELTLHIGDITIRPELSTWAAAGTPGVNGREGYANMVDGSAGTKWCVSMDGTPYIAWAVSDLIQVTGYQLVTANDTASYSGRNPVSWTLYGCHAAAVPKRGSSEWQVIDSVRNSSAMPAANYTPITFKLPAPTAGYNCFLLEIRQTAGDRLTQLSEIVLENAKYKANVYYPQGGGSSGGGGGGGGGAVPSVRINNNARSCWKCNGSGKVTCTQCNGRGYRENYVSAPNYSGRSTTSRTQRENCFKCGGSGKQTCSTCGGSGRQ